MKIDRVDAITPINTIVDRGWRILIPFEDKVDVITQIKILFIGGGGWHILIPYEDQVHVISPINILFIGDGEFRSLMKIGGGEF